MQKKLKDLYRPADNAAQQRATATRLEGMGLGGNLSKPAMDAYNKSINQTKVSMDKFIADTAKGIEYSSKLIAKQEAGLKNLRASLQGMTKDSKDYVQAQENIQRAESNLARQREQLAGRFQSLNQGMDAREGMQGGLRTAIGGMGGAGRFVAGAAGLIGGAGLAASQYTGYGQRLEAAKGSAVQGTVGQDLARVYGGKSAFEQIYSPERRAAEGLAAQKEGRNRITDRMMGIGSAGLIAGGVITGAASLAGAPFTLGGSAVGLAPAGAMIAGGVAGLANDRNRQGIFGGAEYDQLLAAERAKDFRSNYENLKNQDPRKRLALEGYEQNYGNELDTQRMLGLSDQGLRGGGGFQYRGHQAGFMNSQMAGMAAGIVGAGGSSRMGQNAEFGLQMQRAGLTNAGGILGSLSGNMDTASTKQATIGIMAEAFQRGLDSTTFAEENRRFTQSVASVIGRSGATSEADQDRLARTFGQFLGERSNRGVEAAGTAYEAFQQRGSQTSGRRGAVRMAEALSDPNISKLDTQEINELLAARPEQLNSTNPMVMAYAQKAGLQPQELLDRLQGGRDKARFLVPGRKAKVDAYSKNINDYLQKSGMTYSEFAEKANKGGKGLAGEGANEAMNAFGMLQGLISMENPEGYNEKDITAQAGEEITTRNPNATAAQKAKAQADLDTMTRLGDQVNAAGAAGEDESRKALNEMTGDIRKAASAASEFTTAVSGAATALSNASGTNVGKLPQGGGYNLDIVDRVTGKNTPKPNSAVQPKAGVPQ
jgi:hypothetical protein